MSNAQDPYALLGVSRSVDPEALRQAYRDRVKTQHPDLHPNDPAAHERFLRIQVAFEILSDPARREALSSAPEDTWAEARAQAERRRGQLSRRRQRLRRLYD